MTTSREKGACLRGKNTHNSYIASRRSGSPVFRSDGSHAAARREGRWSFENEHDDTEPRRDDVMIIAGIVFLLGGVIGLADGYPAIMVASAAVTALFFSIWSLRGEFGFFSLLVWMGYLFALQSGFLIGAYLATLDERD